MKDDWNLLIAFRLDELNERIVTRGDVKVIDAKSNGRQSFEFKETQEW